MTFGRVRTLLLGPLLVSCQVAAASPADRELAIHLSAEQHAYRLGEPIQLFVTYENIGDDPFYLQRPKGLGPDHLNLVVSLGERQSSVTPQYFDLPTESHRLRYASLFPGEWLKVPVMPLNDPAGFGTPRLPLEGPGEYVLRAVFHSRGAEVEGMVWPVWRGRVQSPELRLTVESPDPEVAREWRLRLRACLAATECEDYDAIEYFRLVRDPEVPEILRALLERRPNYDRTAEALCHQGRAQDGAFLESISRRPDLGAPLPQYYRGLAQNLKAADAPCP